MEPGAGGYAGGPAAWRSSPRGLYDYVAKLLADSDALPAKIRHDSRSAQGAAPAGVVVISGQLGELGRPRRSGQQG
ncbi:MAG: hypothetical protein ACRDP6_34800 [Actinoallomurus sp.]